MTEKIGLIKNPLTIIAIFAGIAEISGTVVLPFIDSENQKLFIYFLIIFPLTLIILFFLTLNFNNKVLYAPSDYQDESNYIKVNRYDLAKQKNVVVKVKKANSTIESLTELNSKIDIIKKDLHYWKNIKAQGSEVNDNNSQFFVSNFSNVNLFVEQMSMKGFDFTIYNPPDDYEDRDFLSQEAIWLGYNVPLEIVKRVIKESKIFYGHLKYIHLSRNDNSETDNEIYIGGSSDSAVNMYGCKNLTDRDFEAIQNFSSIKDLHSFIKKFHK